MTDKDLEFQRAKGEVCSLREQVAECEASLIKERVDHQTTRDQMEKSHQSELTTILG